MKTLTLRIDDKLHSDIQQYAAKRERSLNNYITLILRHVVAHEAKSTRTEPGFPQLNHLE